MITDLKPPGFHSRLQAGILSCMIAMIVMVVMVIPGNIAAQETSHAQQSGIGSDRNHAGNTINPFRVTNDSFQAGPFLPQLRMPGPVQPVISAPFVNQAQVNGKSSVQSICTHVVQHGDTLSEIMTRYLGSSERLPELVRSNPGVDLDRLHVGMVINLPCAAPSTTIAPSVPLWTAEPGENFSDVLMRWASIAKYRVVIRTTDVWTINVPINLHADFENAVSELVAGLGFNGRSPPIRIYSNRVIQFGDH